jgi:hypothetical protein
MKLGAILKEARALQHGADKAAFCRCYFAVSPLLSRCSCGRVTDQKTQRNQGKMVIRKLGTGENRQE